MYNPIISISVPKILYSVNCDLMKILSDNIVMTGIKYTKFVVLLSPISAMDLFQIKYPTAEHRIPKYIRLIKLLGSIVIDIF